MIWSVILVLPQAIHRVDKIIELCPKVATTHDYFLNVVNVYNRLLFVSTLTQVLSSWYAIKVYNRISFIFRRVLTLTSRLAPNILIISNLMFRFSIQLGWTLHMDTHKINLSASQEGYNETETTNGKLLTRNIQGQYSIFMFFGKFMLKIDEKNLHKTWSPHHWIHLIESSSIEILGTLEVPSFVVKLIFR